MYEEQQTRSPHQQFIPISSSKALSWQGLEVGRYILAPGQAELHMGQDQLLLLLYLGQPPVLVQTGTQSAEDCRVQKGDHTLITREDALNIHWPVDVDLLYVNFDLAFVRHILDTSDSDGSQIEFLSHPFTADPSIALFGQMLLNELRSTGFQTRLYAESLGTSLVIHLARHYSTLEIRKLDTRGSFSKIQLQHVLDYIHARYAQNLSVSELAEIANVSPSHFTQLFKQAMGLAPHEYLITCRIEHARQLLISEDGPIHEIAARCGFADQSHLTRHFRRLLGVTPGTLRKEQRNVPEFR